MMYNEKCNTYTKFASHASPLDRLSQKKCPADYLFGFDLHMTPRLWEDVSKLHNQAKF